MTLMLLVLLAAVTTACGVVPVKTARPIEVWAIDPDDATLYREVTPTTEDWMPIKGNDEVRGMKCFAPEDMEELLIRASQ